MALRPFTNNVPGRAVFAPFQSDTYALVLAANTQKQMAIPTGAKWVVFSSTANFYCKIGASTDTVVVPSVDITNATAGELNPEARGVPDGATHISCISSEACTITMMFYGQ